MAKLVFMGTPDFAVPSLETLIHQHNVVGVITQPDRPAGRKQQIQQSPIKQVAVAHGIPIFQPEKLRKAETIAELKAWQPEIDAYIVAAFGQILPQEVLDIPKFGSINVHASLLPRWRGAAPIQTAIREGDTETGITIMLMDAGLDTGPILSQRSILIADDETGQSLHDKLAKIGGELLIETLPQYFAGKIQPQPQDDTQVTFAPTLKKSDGQIDWSQSAKQIEQMVRAYTPWPGTFTTWAGKQIKIHNGTVGDGNAPIGKVIEHDNQIAIGTGDGVFYPTAVQMQGKKSASIDDFVNGYQEFMGATLV